MRIAGRLALENGCTPAPTAGEPPATRRSIGYHGVDVLVRMLNAEGFVAELRGAVPPGAQVRLRLPGLGAAHARVMSSSDGELSARFANPIGCGRLSRVPGFAREPVGSAMNAA